MNFGFAAAAVLLAITFGVHVFLGGIHAARPLLAATDITRGSRWLNYYCWHMVSVLLFALSIAFALAASRADLWPLAAAGVLLSAVFSLLSAAVALKGQIPPLRFPSTSLFALSAAAGLSGFALT